MSGLRAFLATARRAWDAAAAPTVSAPRTIVIGNESADADSCVSAVAQAYYLSRAAPGAPPAAPVMGCARADFALRREAGWLLERCGAGGSDGLVFLDDLTARLPALRREADAGALRVVLVDHNVAWGPVAALGGAVCEIVDHHPDAGAHPRIVPPLRCVSWDAAARRGVGSTCTLVAARLLALGPTDPAVAELLAGVILLDTSGLSPSAGKTTPEDERVVAALARAYAAGTGRALERGCVPGLGREATLRFVREAAAHGRAT